MKSGYRNGQI